MKVLLDAGSGPASTAAGWFDLDDWRLIRMDADPDAKPDVVGDIRDIPLGDEAVDAVHCSHTLEHLAEFEVSTALGEFRRVLKPGGRLVVIVPDLKATAKLIADDHLTDVLYESAAGPIRPLDVVYGHQGYVVTQPLYAHRTGFTGKTLGQALGVAGFEGTVSEFRPGYQLVSDVYRPAHVREPVSS